eukprot:3413227-Amphidinium_carterae.1
MEGCLTIYACDCKTLERHPVVIGILGAAVKVRMKCICSLWFTVWSSASPHHSGKPVILIIHCSFPSCSVCFTVTWKLSVTMRTFLSSTSFKFFSVLILNDLLSGAWVSGCQRHSLQPRLQVGCWRQSLHRSPHPTSWPGSGSSTLAVCMPCTCGP